MAEKSSPGTRQRDGKNLVWFGEIEKISQIIPILTYRSSSLLFYGYKILMSYRDMANVDNKSQSIKSPASVI
jgi:hypothetical protein